MIRITALEVLPYQVAAAQPPHNAQRSWPERRGVLVRLHDQEGRAGQGEAAPLPGLSPDALSACERALGELEVASLPELSPAAPLAALRELGTRFAPLPALRCALEGALLDLMAQVRAEPAWATLRAELPNPSSGADRVPVAALLQEPDPAGRLAEADRAVARGIRTLKVKVGRPGELARELAELEGLRARFGPDTAIRVDANRAWTAAEAEQHLEALAALRVEYVEEPTADWHGLTRSAAPLALDESLVAPELLGAILHRRKALKLSACVLKPTLLGGVVPVLQIARVARQAGLTCVVSHAFEGPVGFALASALSLTTMDGTRAAGLGAHAYLRAWAALPAWLMDAAIGAWDAPGWGLPLLEPPVFR